MPEPKTTIRVNVDDLSLALGHINDLNSKKNDYIEVLKYLKYDDPSSITPGKFDAILLKAIDEYFIGISKDIIRMALGLMLGFEREIKIGKRREHYLENSNFTKDFTMVKGDYDKASKEQKKKYRNSLIDAERERIRKLASYLAEKVENEIFEEYIIDLKGYFDDEVNAPILQSPIYLDKNRANYDEKKSEPENGSTDPRAKSAELDDDSSSEDDGPQNDAMDTSGIPTKYLAFGLIALLLLLGFILIVLFIVTRRNDNSVQKDFSEISKIMKQKEQTPPDKIEIKDNNIYLPLDGDYHLYVEIGIDGLNTDNLECESLDSDIVEVLGRTDEYIKATKGLEDDIKYDSGIVEYHIKATKKLKKNTKNRTDIVVHSSNKDSPKDRATITVIDPTTSVDSRGKNDAESPGNLE